MQAQASGEWRAHGTIVLAAFTGLSLLSVMTGSLSIFIEPIAKSFGWTRTLVASGYTCATVVTALLSPFFGIVIDRFGSRRVALPGIVATIVSISLFSLTNGSPTQWIGLWIIYALVALGIKTTVWTAAVAGTFEAGRGLALGLTLCGTAAAQVILPPLANALIDHFGWRTAYLLLGTGWGSVTLLLCWLFLHDRISLRRGASRAGKAALDTAQMPGLTIAQAWRSRDLWSIVGATLIVMTLTIGFQIHQVPILEQAGVTRDRAALLASLSGVAAIAGKLVTGVLLDAFAPRWVGAATLAVTALAFAAMLRGGGVPALIVLGMLINGYAQGTSLQVCSYLTAAYGGIRNFGQIFGFMTSVIAIGSGIGPLIAAAIYDRAGNYTGFLVLGAAGSLLAAMILLLLRPIDEGRWQVRTV